MTIDAGWLFCLRKVLSKNLKGGATWGIQYKSSQQNICISLTSCLSAQLLSEKFMAGNFSGQSTFVNFEKLNWWSILVLNQSKTKMHLKHYHAPWSHQDTYSYVISPRFFVFVLSEQCQLSCACAKLFISLYT